VLTTNWVPTRVQTGHNLGMEITGHPLSRRIGTGDLAPELRRLVRRGLPPSLAAAGDVLPNLRNVVARAIHPDDPVSRIDSLNTLLTRFIQGMTDDRLGEPARIIFGLASGTGRTTLTSRRSAAAQWLGYDPDHFRKRVEPQILEAVADLLYRDMLRYKKRATGGDQVNTYATWALTDDDITAEEELSAIVWKFVYAVRAELIGARRQEHEEGFETRVAEHYRMASKYEEALTRAVDNYRHLFGPIIRNRGIEYRVEGLLSR
jgi:hypothetical protein